MPAVPMILRKKNEACEEVKTDPSPLAEMVQAVQWLLKHDDTTTRCFRSIGSILFETFHGQDDWDVDYGSSIQTILLTMIDIINKWEEVQSVRNEIYGR